MTEEFNLSKKRHYELGEYVYSEDSVKEFIKRLKKELLGCYRKPEDFQYINKCFDEIAGKKLI